jgi:hypothetical protein
MIITQMHLVLWTIKGYVKHSMDSMVSAGFWFFLSIKT